MYTEFSPLFLLQSVFQSKEAYYKYIGHREDDGKIESVKDYLKRVESYMKLYGALVQVCHYLSYGQKSLNASWLVPRSISLWLELSSAHWVLMPYFLPLNALRVGSWQRMRVLTDRSSGYPEQSWSKRRLGMACEVLKYSPCQYIYCCCIECIPSSKFVWILGVLIIIVFKGIMELKTIYFSADSRVCSFQ